MDLRRIVRQLPKLRKVNPAAADRFEVAAAKMLAVVVARNERIADQKRNGTST